MYYLQHVSRFEKLSDAKMALIGVFELESCLGARINDRTSLGEGYNVQSFYPDCANMPLPDGVRRVYIPTSLYQALKLGQNERPTT
jgi:hypothetical protein